MREVAIEHVNCVFIADTKLKQTVCVATHAFSFVKAVTKSVNHVNKPFYSYMS